MHICLELFVGFVKFCFFVLVGKNFRANFSSITSSHKQVVELIKRVLITAKLILLILDQKETVADL